LLAKNVTFNHLTDNSATRAPRPPVLVLSNGGQPNHHQQRSLPGRPYDILREVLPQPNPTPRAPLDGQE
jgi:hypothetical protein